MRPAGKARLSPRAAGLADRTKLHIESSISRVQTALCIVAIQSERLLMTESIRVVKMKTLESRGRVGSATWCGTRSWKPAVAWQPVVKVRRRTEGGEAPR